MDRYEEPLSFDISEPRVPVPPTISYAGEVTAWRPLRLTSKDFDVTEAKDTLPIKQEIDEDGDNTV